MNIFNIFRRGAGKESDVYDYSEEEADKVESFISENFGHFDSVFHEFASDEIHVDICIIPPTNERNFITLVTMGMGAKKMNVPSDMKDQPRSRAELLICLPPDWPLSKDSLEEGKWYWPIYLLKALTRLPFGENSWIGYGHSIEFGEPFDESTQQKGAMLVNPQFANSNQCSLTKRKVINFYQIIPLYKEEMDFKMEHDAEELLKFFTKEDMIVNPIRKSVLNR